MSMKSEASAPSGETALTIPPFCTTKKRVASAGACRTSTGHEKLRPPRARHRSIAAGWGRPGLLPLLARCGRANHQPPANTEQFRVACVAGERRDSDFSWGGEVSSESLRRALCAVAAISFACGQAAPQPTDPPPPD